MYDKKSKLNNEPSKSKTLAIDVPKNFTCQTNFTRSKKSPRMLQNLVFPSKEYYDSPLDQVAGKFPNEFLSKESSNSMNTHFKKISGCLIKKANNQSIHNPKKNDSEVSIKQEFFKSKTFFRERKSHFTKNQLPSFKQNKKAKIKISIINLSSKRSNVEKIKCLTSTLFQSKDMFKSKIIRQTYLQKSLFSIKTEPKKKLNEIINFAKTHNRIFPTDKKSIMLDVKLIEILIKTEFYLSSFLWFFYNDKTIKDPFFEYLEWTIDENLQSIIDKIKNQNLKIKHKSALLFERVSLYICYFIFKKDVNKEETIFLKKTIIHIYLNFMALVKELRSFIPIVD